MGQTGGFEKRPGGCSLVQQASESGASSAVGKRTLAEQEPPTVYRSAKGDRAKVSGGEAFGVATSGPASDVPYRASMERSFGEDFSNVRAHLGGNAAEVGLDALGARAAAQANSVAFESSSPSQELVAHELTHVVQQRRGGALGPQGKSDVSMPGDAAEVEADAIASRVVAGERVEVTGTAGGGIHRDIKTSTPEKVPLGEFEIDMTKFEGSVAGEDGTVTFRPNEKAKDTADIRLSQAVRTFNLDTSAEHDWSKDGAGKEADRNKMQTTAADKTHVAKKGDTLKSLAMRFYGDPGRTTEIYDANKTVLTSPSPDDPIKAGTSVKIPNAVEGGYFIDHVADDARATPRTAKTDDQVPQDYVWPGEEATNNKHGSKKGKTIDPAMLYDRPGTPHNLMFNFETVARSVDLGIYYGTIHWDFQVKGGKVSKEGYKVVPGVSETFKGALDEFNEFYKNKHVVMKGESLWKIAEHYYGDGNKWPDIYKANKDIIKDPDHIEPGWELNIPSISAGV